MRLAAKPLAWAIRREMLVGNLEQVNEYLVQWVREPAIQLVLVAGDDGRIVASTDKKLEGQLLAVNFPELPADVKETTLVKSREGLTLVWVPIYGLESRLGTVLFSYVPPKVEVAAVPPPVTR